MKTKVWISVYTVLGACSIISYFAIKHFLQYTDVAYIKLSNLTLNLLIFVVAWGAGEPYLYKLVFHRKQSFFTWITILLVGFLVILLLLKATGMHTRI